MHEHEHVEPRSGGAAQAAEWDARYSERDGVMWSGRPNGRLVAEVAHLAPGRALDVGCGEGADAIWLAQQGWMVTAIDISDVALCRLLGDAFTVELNAVEPRIDPPADAPHIADVVLRARRR